MKIQIITGIILLALIAAIIAFWPRKNSVDIEDSTVQTAVESAGVSAPDINPVSNTNPFAGIKINPFE